VWYHSFLFACSIFFMFFSMFLPASLHVVGFFFGDTARRWLLQPGLCLCSWASALIFGPRQREPLSCSSIICLAFFFQNNASVYFISLFAFAHNNTTCILQKIYFSITYALVKRTITYLYLPLIFAV
jgi:hypothetical protein